jgi:hypothetical protein
MGALRRQFDEFDKDGSGFLERQECVAALAKLGSKLTLHEDVDKDGDNRISFEEVTIKDTDASHRMQRCKSHTAMLKQQTSRPPALQPPISQKSASVASV